MRVGEDERPILRDVIEDEDIVPLVAFGPTRRGEPDQNEGHPEQAWLLRLVQRFARHVNIHTTTIYAQPTEEDLMRAVRELPC
jgi:hypothetical protein